MKKLGIKINIRIPESEKLWDKLFERKRMMDQIFGKLFVELKQIDSSGLYNGEKLKDMIDFDSRNDYLQKIIKAVDNRHCSENN